MVVVVVMVVCWGGGVMVVCGGGGVGGLWGGGGGNVVVHTCVSEFDSLRGRQLGTGSVDPGNRHTSLQSKHAWLP